MKTKLVPLALLIPAVVLAQPAPMSSSQGGMPPSQAITPPASTMPSQPVNPVNQAKAASALKNAKELSGKLKGGSLSNEESRCGSGYTTWTTPSGGGECLRT